MLAAPGADNVNLARAIAKLLPPGVEVVSGQAVANELSSAVDNSLGFISTVLLIFAAIALFVGGFTIFNTFSITVGQRTRELALLRVVGASRRQVFRSVLGEAALTGLVASLIGLGLGVLAALGLKALLKAFGIELPSAPLVFEARTVVVAIAVGVGVTVISAIVPARRAVRIAPVAALVEDGGVGDELVRPRRVIAGIAVAALGVRRGGGGAGQADGRARRPRRGAGVHRGRHARARASPGRSRARSDARWPRCSARRESSGGRTRCATRAGPRRPPPR